MDKYSLKKENFYNAHNKKLKISDDRTLAKFSLKIAKQEDCPPEFLDIVNKEFWNLI